jgi:methionyl-tRNA formyltransferase
MKTKTLFVGSGMFAIEILKSIIDSDELELTGIVTQPDKPTGRKKILTPTELKQYTLENHPALEKIIYTPLKIKESYQNILDETGPELIVVASYGQIIPKAMLDYPKYKALNIHGSILPDLRGAVPIQMSILNGYEDAGVTIQIMSEKMDEGDIVATVEERITPEDTTESLMYRLSLKASYLFKQIIPEWIDGKIKPTKQDHTKATYCYQVDISKEKAEIDIRMHTSKYVERAVRAFYPWPIAWLKLSKENVQNENLFGKILKIYKVKHTDIDSNQSIGKIFRQDKSLYLQLEDGSLELVELQLEGKNKMSGSDYLFLVN